MFLENPEIGGTRLIQTIFHAIVSSSSVVPFVRLKYVTLLQYTLLTHLVRRFIPLGYEPWVFERVQGLNCDSPGNNIASLTPSTLPCSLVSNQIQPSLSLSSTSNPTQPSATTPAVPAISSSWDLPQNMSAMFRAKCGPTDPRAKTDTLCGPSECKMRSIIVVYSIS